MKVSLNWLTDYVKISIPVHQLGELLTQIGLNLEEIIETDSDVILDLEVTSNRPDCLGHLGVAREIAAATGENFKLPVISKQPTSGKVEELASIEVLDPQLCPRYTARIIRGVKVGPSPQWMIERLKAVGLRSVNNIVDVTNYVLMEYSQPLHSFDFDKLTGGKIIVRRAQPGEMLISIDQTPCRLDEDMLVIADTEKAVALAGVMGALNTEVTENTTNLLIESAQFDPLSTRHTSRKLQLMSESNYRFERGVDPVAIEQASLRACQLITELAGGTLAKGFLDVWAQPFQPRTVILRPSQCDRLLGRDIPAEQQTQVLARLDVEPKLKDSKILCTIPSHRADLTREADLIEEVARMVGYDAIPISGKVSHAVVGESLEHCTRRIVGQALTAVGFDETITGSFIDTEEAQLFGWENALQIDPNVRKTNNILRISAVPTLLRVCKTNQDAGHTDVSFFELAQAFPQGDNSDLPAEYTELALATTRELHDLRGALEATVLAVTPQARLEIRPRTLSGFAEKLSADVMMDNKPMGLFGVVSANVLDYYGLHPDRPVAVASLRFKALCNLAAQKRTYQPVARFPAVRRDLSVVVTEHVTWSQLAEAIAAVSQPMRVGLAYATTYRGKPIRPGYKSVTITLTYRSDEGTLRSQQVDQLVAEIVEALQKDFSAELRG